MTTLLFFNGSTPKSYAIFFGVATAEFSANPFPLYFLAWEFGSSANFILDLIYSLTFNNYSLLFLLSFQAADVGFAGITGMILFVAGSTFVAFSGTFNTNSSLFIFYVFEDKSPSIKLALLITLF